jgi:hypothetical protein
VLSHCTESDWDQSQQHENGDERGDLIAEIDSNILEVDDESESSWTSVMQHLGISDFRPNQKEALDIIEQAHNLSQQEHRLTTVGIVVPTSSGKDLVPLALSEFTGGVSIMFVPFT